MGEGKGTISYESMLILMGGNESRERVNSHGGKWSKVLRASSREPKILRNHLIIQFFTVRLINYPLKSLLILPETLELFVDSTKALIGSWLFCIQYFPCLISFRHMLEVNAEERMQNIQYRLMDGQTHFGISRGLKMSLVPNEPK